MIKHVIFMKFKAGTADHDIAELSKGLAGLPGAIPEIKEFQFGRDIVHSERSFDFALVSAFDNMEAMQRYQVHPQHLPVAAKVRELSESVLAVDFEF